MSSFLRVSAIVLFCLANCGFSQSCGEGAFLKEGASWEMGSFDKKGSLEATTLSTIKKATQSAGNFTWLIQALVSDKKGKKVMDNEMEVKCENGNFYFNPKPLLDPKQMQGMKDMEIKIESIDLEYPKGMKKGMNLKNGSINVKAFSSGIQIFTMLIEVADRTVEEFEDLTVKGGTFKAFKLSQTIKVSNSLIKMESKSVDYYVPGFGVIKTINYNKKGEQEGYSELLSFKK